MFSLKIKPRFSLLITFSLLLLLPLVGQSAPLTLSAINFTSQSGDKLQVQMDLSGGNAPSPKVFKTDNPARIVLDFADVKNGLPKKIYPINQGAALNAYVIEANGRVRVILNLLESMPYDVNVDGESVLLTLAPTSEAKSALAKQSQKPKVSSIETTKATNAKVAEYIPEQAISGFDFKRGDKDEGRILVSLANPNTVVNSKKENGKVVINFLNTQLPNGLAKRLDVSEFATPVKFIDTVSKKQETTLTVTTVDDMYDYSVFQADGLLTVEFRPITDEEKEAQDKMRVKYTGDRLSLNFQNIEIRNIIAILAEFTNQNMVASDDVTGTITLKLDDVPWDEALDFIMMTKELGKYQTGNVILISPLDKIKGYKEKQQQVDEIVEKSDALVTEYLKINFAKAESFKKLLNGMDTGSFGTCGANNTSNSSNASVNTTGSSSVNVSNDNNKINSPLLPKTDSDSEKFEGNRILSTRGSAIVDSRTNTLIVKDTGKKLEDVKKLIHKLDIPVQQVMIESRIVIADDSFARNLGVKFGAGKQGALSDSSGFAIGGKGTRGNGNALPSTTDGSMGVLNDSLFDLGAQSIGATPPAALGMTLVRGADYVLNLEVQALQSDGRGESISNPRVMTMNRCTAHIMQGVQVPYVTLPTGIANGAQAVVPTVTFKDATLALNVTPQITPSGSVLMNLVIKKDNINEAASAALQGANLVLDKREIQTSVLVSDGETIVLGGVYEDNDSTTKNKIPFFSDLPFIGNFFTNSSIKNTKKELLIFVTPKIVKDSEISQQ